VLAASPCQARRSCDTLELVTSPSNLVPPAQPRLLLIEDDAKLARLIERVLKETYAVTVRLDGRAGLEAARVGHFDVMVIDRRLPRLTGIQVIEALRKDGVPTPMLMLTALGTVGDKVDGLDAGANDYLVKPFEFDELLARLRSISRIYTGEGPFTKIGLWEFYAASRAIYSPYEGRIILTQRESDLLGLFASNPGQTFSREEILHRVFHEDEQLGTVDTYVHYLRRKTTRDIVTTIRGRGYRLGVL
jgi:two-component system response regulator QseB